MENISETKIGMDIISKSEENSNVKSIHFSDNQFIIKDEPQMAIKSDELFPTNKLSGAYLQGIQYYDLKIVRFINNPGMADLKNLLNSLLKKVI